jgi:hypothetical protein
LPRDTARLVETERKLEEDFPNCDDGEKPFYLGISFLGIGFLPRSNLAE